MDLTVVHQQLSEDGFRPVKHTDGSIEFKYEGGIYFVDTDPKDEMYLRVSYPGFWTPETPVQIGASWEQAGVATESMKAVKVYMHKGKVHCTVEQFLVRPEDFRLILPRVLSSLQSGVRRFAGLMSAYL